MNEDTNSKLATLFKIAAYAAPPVLFGALSYKMGEFPSMFDAFVGSAFGGYVSLCGGLAHHYTKECIDFIGKKGYDSIKEKALSIRFALAHGAAAFVPPAFGLLAFLSQGDPMHAMMLTPIAMGVGSLISGAAQGSIQDRAKSLPEATDKPIEATEAPEPTMV